MAGNQETVIDLCRSEPEDIALRRGATLVLRSPDAEATITFDPDPFGGDGTYTVPRGEQLRLSVPQDARGAYDYDVRCRRNEAGGGGPRRSSGGPRRGKRPRVIIRDQRA